MATFQYAPGFNIGTLKPGDILDLGTNGQFSKTPQGGFQPVTPSSPAPNTPKTPTTPATSPTLPPGFTAPPGSQVNQGAGNINAPSVPIISSNENSGVITSESATPPPAIPSGPNTNLIGAILAGTSAPTPPDLTKILAASSIPDLQRNLSSIQQTQLQLQTAYQNYVLKLNGQGEPQGLVDVLSDDQAKNLQIQLNTLNEAASIASSNLSNAMTWVQEMMNTQQTDYQNAVQSYNDTFTRAYQFQTLYNSAATTQQQNAGAYLTSVGNMISSSGVNWDNVSPGMKATIQQMEAQAGWPAGTLQAFAKMKPGANIIGSTTTVAPNGLAQQNIIHQNPDGTYSITTVQLPGTVPSVFGAGNYNPYASGSGSSPATGYNGSILQGTNLSPVTPLSTILTDPSSTQTLFEAMAAAEGGPNAAGAQYNNPLDLKYVPGMQGATDSGVKAKDGGTFAAFPSLDAAYQTYKDQLTAPQYQGLTLDQALQKWSNYQPASSPNLAATSYIDPSTGAYSGPSLTNGDTPQAIVSALSSGPSFVSKGATYDQATLYNAAITSMLGGTNTTTGGMGSAPGRAAIANKTAAIMQAFGINQFQVTAAQTEYKALSAANIKLVGQNAFIKTYTGTATDALNLASQNYNAVGNTPIKIINNYKNWLAGNFTPAGPLAALETNIYTAAREYAKVTGGGAASSAALTDTASEAVDKLLNSAQTPEQFQATVQQMQNDMAITNQNFDKQIAAFAPSIASIYQQMNPASYNSDSAANNSSSTPDSITVNGHSYQIGSTITVGGTSYLINPDGTVTPQ